VFRAAGSVLFDEPAPAEIQQLPEGVVLLTDAFEQANSEVRGGLDRLVGAMADQVGGGLIETELARDGQWNRWVEAFGVQQRREAWEVHGDFYERHGSAAFGGDVAARFEHAKRDRDSQVIELAGQRDEVAERIEELTDGGSWVLLLPAAPTRAPRRARPDLDADNRAQLLRLTSVASMAGAPSVTLPSRTQTGSQVGLSLLGAPGTDEMLIDLAARVYEFLSY